MARVAGLGRSIVAAMRPSGAPWAFEPAVCAMLAAALVAGAGVLTGDLQVVGVAYLGAACAVTFLTTGFYRSRWRAWVAQALGGALGVSIGAQFTHGAGVIPLAAAAGMVSGMAGAIGPNAPAFGMMLSIGVAFGQFGGSSLAWWQQALSYLIGTAISGVAVLGLWVWRRDGPERRALAQVIFAAADLCAAIGTDNAGPARDRLAAASATVRATRDRRPSDLVAFAAATLYAQGRPVPGAVIGAMRRAGEQVWAGEPVSVGFSAADAGGDPGLVELADALSADPVRPGAPLPSARRLSALVRAATSHTALSNGVRIGLCLAVATSITVAVGQRDHSFWLPLTTAVIVRPEYASVFVRMVNRVLGTIIGAMLATALLAVCSSGLPLVAAVALALGFAVLSAPKLYGLSVVGITTAALLSQSIDHPDQIAPAIRLEDTLIGAAVAVVFGYLLWPGARRPPTPARSSLAVEAAETYLREAVKPAGRRRRWQSSRDDAYRLAHLVRATAESAMLEPPPVSSAAEQVIPAVIELEDAVDAITAIGSAVDAGIDSAASIDDVRRRLRRLDEVVNGTTGFRTRSSLRPRPM